MTQPPAPPMQTATGAPAPGQYPAGAGFAPGYGPGPGPFGPAPTDPHYGPPPGWVPPAAPAPASKGALLAGLLQFASLVLVPLGAALPFGSNFSSSAMWATATTWAAFATLAAVIQLAPFFGRVSHRPPAASWKLGAVGVGSLIGFWVLIVLPGISSGQNFVLTLGVMAAAIGLWLSPGRQL